MDLLLRAPRTGAGCCVLVAAAAGRKWRASADRKRRRHVSGGLLALRDDGSELGVLRLLVSAQVDLALEGSAAKVAGEGLEAGVLPGVGDQV